MGDLNGARRRDAMRKAILITSAGREGRTGATAKREWRSSFAGRIEFRPTGSISRLKRYLMRCKGIPLQTVVGRHLIADNSAQPRNARLSNAETTPVSGADHPFSSNENDIVLDAFCGCGTALVAAQNLKRQWIGIDISPTACRVMAKRLRDDCGSARRRKALADRTRLCGPRPPWTEEKLRKYPRSNLRIGRSSRSAAFRTKPKSATWGLTDASFRSARCRTPRRAHRRNGIHGGVVSDSGEAEG